MTQRCFIDTNILVYSISTDPVEQPKRQRSIEILAEADCAVSVQVLQEFYVRATRQNRLDAISHEHALRLIESWRRFPVQETTLPILDAALEICRVHRFSYWDSAIIAAARALGCETLYTEDLSHGREVEGLRIVNPFREF